MNTAHVRGFTLIELLVVIAIIGILAGLVSVALPGALERAKIAKVEADFRAISGALTQYYTDHESFPAAYGFRAFPPDPPRVHLGTYMADIGLFGALNFYDKFAVGFGYDSNRDKIISRLEYAPYDPVADKFRPEDPPPVYAGGLAPTGRMIQEQRPYIYAPYNSKQMDKLLRTVGNGNIWDGRVWNTSFDLSLGYPPPRYDGFVLVSVGPGGNTGGLVVPPDENAFLAPVFNHTDDYNVLALRTAYLGSRDVNENGLLDFDFRARTRNAEAKPESYATPGFNLLPDGTNAGGPLIFLQH